LGGIYSYEIARQLIILGEVVQGIILVDSPCPTPLPDMPKPTVELLEKAGMFAGVENTSNANDPKMLHSKNHIVACINALRFYDPLPIPLDKRPTKVVQIWAKHPTVGRLSDKKVEDLQETTAGNSGWLQAPRRSFGPNGWEKLVGTVECHVLDGDHFSIMQTPRVSQSLSTRKMNNTDPLID